jgi:hypothetical protein
MAQIAAQKQLDPAPQVYGDNLVYSHYSFSHIYCIVRKKGFTRTLEDIDEERRDKAQRRLNIERVRTILWQRPLNVSIWQSGYGT